MHTHSLKTLQISFPDGDIKTDSLLYREKSHLLVPEPYTQNLYTVIFDEFQTNFYISSDSETNLERLQAFFSRIYDTTFQEMEEAVHGEYSDSVILVNSPRNAKSKEFYHPRFVRNLLDYVSVDRRASIRYTVSVRSGTRVARKPAKFNFNISIGFNSPTSANKFRDLLRNELVELRREAKYRIRPSGKGRFRDNLLSLPFVMINFIRVPSAYDLIV